MGYGLSLVYLSKLFDLFIILPSFYLRSSVGQCPELSEFATISDVSPRFGWNPEVGNAERGYWTVLAAISSDESDVGSSSG